jgi:outer membrane lipopolysaccharide assembly protein LptE/RlpB
MKRWLPLLPILLLAACGKEEKNAFPEPDSLPALQVQVDNPTPKIGEPTRVDLRLSGEKRMLLPPLSDLLDPAVELLDEESTVTETEDRWQRDIRLNVALYAVTNVTLFAQSETTTLSTPEHTFELPFIHLDVTPVLGEDADQAVPKLGNTDLPDFRGPEALARRRRNLFISLAVLALLLAFLAAWFWHLRNRPKPPPPPPVWHRIALREMDELQATDIWQQPDVDASAVALSDILRRYIEGRFEIHAPERTTEEFLLEVQDRAPWPEEEQTGLREFFEATDRIKFAGDRPGRERLDALMEAARRFVTATADREGAA